jgi:Uma2 family endonuclease
MVAHANVRFVTPLEYLECERSAETKSEYHDGVVVAMAGADPEHDRITGNIYANLHAQLRGTPCEPFTSDMRVHVPACNRYFYPDVSVACGGSRFELLAGVRSLQNPTLIVEVLSESTEAVDRGDKWICYQALPSLSTYLIVAQTRPQLQIYERQSDGAWSYRLYQGLEAAVRLPAVGCGLQFGDIYARVEFGAEGRAV